MWLIIRLGYDPNGALVDFLFDSLMMMMDDPVSFSSKAFCPAIIFQTKNLKTKQHEKEKKHTHI